MILSLRLVISRCKLTNIQPKSRHTAHSTAVITKKMQHLKEHMERPPPDIFASANALLKKKRIHFNFYSTKMLNLSLLISF